MLAHLYEWIQNIAYYMILVTALMQALPDKEYKKYIQFFTGLVLILLILSPVLRLLQLEPDISGLYGSREAEAYEKEIEDAAAWEEELKQEENVDSKIGNVEIETGGSIQIGEVQVGHEEGME